MITATLVVDGEEVHTIFTSEEQRLLNDRAEYSTSASGGKTTISVSAQDATALRALLNSVCKTLIVHEKMKALVKKDD